MRTVETVKFLVTREPVGDVPRPVVGLDGPVLGADLLFDHHATGEAITLLALPRELPFPGTIATTMLDGDAVIGAAALLLRACGEEAVLQAAWPVLYEAAFHCDLLGASGEYPESEKAGLGLHCWLKDKGFALGALRAWSRGEVVQSKEVWRPAPSVETRSDSFRKLTLALIGGIRKGAIPSDDAWLHRIEAMAGDARRAVRCVRGGVAMLYPDGFLDPVAIYRAVSEDVVVLVRELPGGHFGYSVGVRPQVYGRYDLNELFGLLNEIEDGWGGRAYAGGSPMNGSRIAPEALAMIIERVFDVPMFGNRVLDTAVCSDIVSR